MSNQPAVAVLGGSGYVAGEAIRLLSGHPVFRLAAVSSAGNIGVPLSEAFPHLQPVTKGQTFCEPSEIERLIEDGEVQAVLAALPHGESEQTLVGFAHKYPNLKIVDLAADLRFHPEVFFGLPELCPGNPGNLVANPGCFATCMTLAAAPLIGLETGDFVAFGVTGSTGSGRTPKPTTHHPERHSGFWAYEPLRHRHRKEVWKMLDFGNRKFMFVPHSAPLSRGMHVTVTSQTLPETDLLDIVKEFYRDAPMVVVKDRGFPNVKDVVGTNFCHIGVAQDGDELAVMAVIDNLVKGAAGGGIQWLNRMFGLPDESGLTTPALGWN